MAAWPDVDAVRELAYRLWQKRAPFEGSAESDWIRAEQMLSNEAAARNTGAVNTVEPVKVRKPRIRR